MNKKFLQSGFSLLEVTMVVVIVALSVIFYFKEARRPLREAYSTLINYQAGVFTRNVNVLRTLASSNRNKYVEHQGTRIFFNEFGWPANTEEGMSPHSSNQTAVECLQLWQGIFQNPLKASVNLSGDKENISVNSRYKIYSKNGNTCRYQLAGNEEAGYFFDYDLRTGAVITSSKLE